MGLVPRSMTQASYGNDPVSISTPLSKCRQSKEKKKKRKIVAYANERSPGMP
jgi:hypothetical protein